MNYYELGIVKLYFRSSYKPYNTCEPPNDYAHGAIRYRMMLCVSKLLQAPVFGTELSWLSSSSSVYYYDYVSLMSSQIWRAA